MSQINEGTVVLKKTAEPLFLADIANDNCMTSGEKKVYEDDEHVVYVFDCNGDAPWMSGFDGQQLYGETGLVAAETCFLEDGGVWTEFTDDISDRYHIRGFLRKIVPLDKLDAVRKSISYSK